MKRVILLSVLILLISLAYSFAEVPCKINYQGRLIENNVPVDGTKTMKFTIYNSLQGGDELWTSGDVDITVYNGLFRYVLGEGFIDGSPVDDLSGINWTAGEELYLQVIVDGETLTPLEAIYAYPYAINSHLLEGATKEYFINTSGEAQTKQGDLNIMGNVGIGTTSPNSKLDVSGAIKYSGSYPGTILYGNTSSAGTPTGDGFRVRYDGQFWGTTRDVLIIEKTDGNQDSPDGGIAFVNTGQDGIEDTAMVIRGNGNVGIGTTSPGEKLTVAGTIESTTGGVKFPDGSIQTTAAAGFGSPADKDSAGNTFVVGVVYRVTSDGFVVATVGGDALIRGYTGTTNPPTFWWGGEQGLQGNWDNQGYIMFPVAEGEYWRVTQQWGPNPYWIRWRPIGNGQCVRQ